MPVSANMGDFESALLELNLTVHQQKRIQAIQKESKLKMNSLKKQIKDKQYELNSLLKLNSSSDVEINKLKSDIDLLDEEINEVKSLSRKNIKNILSNEQKNMLIELQFAK
ncbi:MAG: Spy/CpxP family protein refolding chaperone [Candidatus Caenarcaniphilales bacterium]|nr:Spy/CpxP family protein refolding chaperone [Candidatus Caenarcaniphilales bacterium]